MKQVKLEMLDPIPGRPEVCSMLEAILFAAGCPVTYEKIALALEITPKKAKEVAQAAALRYEDRGIELLCFDDSCQLCTRAKYEDAIKTALELRRSGVLSNASLEVLAVIAYHQPVTRAYVEQVRGVDSTYAVSSLCDKGLIAPCGRLDVPGRPMLYETTAEFLRVFGIDSLTELPEIDVLTAGTVKEEAAKEEASPTATKTGTEIDDKAKAEATGEVIAEGAETDTVREETAEEATARETTSDEN